MSDRRPPTRRAAWLHALLGSIVLVGGCGGRDERHGHRTVVLVTVDTLRRDHVGAFSTPSRPSPSATPRIDGLATSGLRFDDARTPAVLTLPAHVTMLSGLPPAVHGVRTNSASRVPPVGARPWRLVPEVLRAQGRCAGAFVSAGPLAARYGLDAAFDAYDDGDLGSRTALAYAERPGAQTVERALAWLATAPSSRDVFLWVHLFEPHEPCPDGYARDVEAADAAVGALLDGLAATGRADAAIVLASDHGEALGDLGERTHGFLLPESVLRVPLVVRAPGVAPGVRSDPADLADVAPLLLRLCGAPALALPEVPGAGQDLLGGPAAADRPRIAEALHAWHQYRWAQLTCAVVGPWKLEDRGQGRERLFQRQPGEVLGQDAGVAAEARAESRAPAEALRRYRRLEDRRPGVGGAAPGGYGRGGSPGFFLEPTENARRPDPYEVIDDAYRLNRAAATILLEPPLAARIEKALDEVATLEARDPGNPSLAFWRGRGLRILARHLDAQSAFQRALDLGGCEPEALLLLLRSAAAGGDVPAALGAFERCQGSVPGDRRLLEAAAALNDAAGVPARAAALRAQAEETPARPAPGAVRTCR